LSKKQNKLFEVYVAKKSLLGVHPKDFDVQEVSKRVRLEKLSLLHLCNKLILDAGCGPGTYGLLLAQRSEVIGVDISVDSAKMAK
jgi:methylase of polypeptide subunit release factors